MLGHLSPSPCQLDKETKQNYQNFYCSICASLRKQHNLAYSAFINNELTLVLLSLKSYYQDDTLIAGKTPCPSSLFTFKNAISKHQAIDTAAQLSVLLGWIKVVDWAVDNPRFYKKTIRNILSKKVKKTIPKLNPKFQKIIEEYILLTQNDSTDYEKVRQYSGLLSYHTTLEIGQKTDILQDKLENIGELFRLCGELISVADHLIDLDKDLKNNQYNPIIFEAQKQNIELFTAYQKLRLEHNRLKINILDKLNQLFKENIIQDNFRQALHQALNKIEQNIQSSFPKYFHGLEKAVNTEGLIIAKSDCAGGGLECECLANSGQVWDNYVAQCCCNNHGGSGQCCCKGSGGGGQCCCDNCGKGGSGGGGQCCLEKSNGQCCCKGSSGSCCLQDCSDSCGKCCGGCNDRCEEACSCKNWCSCNCDSGGSGGDSGGKDLYKPAPTDSLIQEKPDSLGQDSVIIEDLLEEKPDSLPKKE